MTQTLNLSKYVNMSSRQDMLLLCLIELLYGNLLIVVVASFQFESSQNQQYSAAAVCSTQQPSVSISKIHRLSWLSCAKECTTTNCTFHQLDQHLAKCQLFHFVPTKFGFRNDYCRGFFSKNFIIKHFVCVCERLEQSL